ncbi:MAG: beta-ketoacyl synthase N-terminal-like domain-containing protein [Acidobacteriota bacterium]|jgi:3-oxoacyl-(acyl-carrier-protein) synthase
MTRVGIFGWGIVAPKSPDIDSFAANLASGESWLTAFDGFGPSPFLVGKPEFDFRRYKPWVDERFPPSKFPQLEQKMGGLTQYALGAFIQALEQNPGIERTLQELGPQTQVLIGTGVGDLPTQYAIANKLRDAQRRWNRFWAAAAHNDDRARYDAASDDERAQLAAEWCVPANPRQLPPDSFERESAFAVWDEFWMQRSNGLREYLGEFEAIEALGIQGDINAGKLHVIRKKKSELARLESKWECPTPPWLAVNSNLIWNIANTPAAQVSMMGNLTGAAYAPIAACSSFGVALKLARQAIACGDAKAVVVGMSDPAPHPILVGAFYRARVLSADGKPSLPLTNLRGTHISGGSVVWIVGDYDYMTAQGYEPLGLEVVGVGITSDAQHIITPSEDGPLNAIRLAVQDAGADPDQFSIWDLHATATPGDFQEVNTLRRVFPNHLVVTARKGVFGHGMAASGGWELTAQYLGISSGELEPTPLTEDIINPAIHDAPYDYVYDVPHAAPPGLAGKLSMGIGGINACVISRRWDEGPTD